MPEREFENWIELSRHPASRPEVVRSIRARLYRSGARLQVGYRLEGEIGRILVPTPSEPIIGAELWRHTCFEAFVEIEGAGAYHEFNFAPSGEWTVYAFSGYRTGVPLTDETMCPQIVVRSAASHMELDAVIQLDRLSALHPRGVLRLGLAAVIETGDGLSYWALRHPAGKPDFHKTEGFVLRLEPPEQRQRPED
jgi:hypothetical protein